MKVLLAFLLLVGGFLFLLAAIAVFNAQRIVRRTGRKETGSIWR